MIAAQEIPEAFRDKLVFTNEETAEILRICRGTLWNLRKRGLIRPVIGTSRTLYTRKEILRFLDETSETIDL